MVLAAKIFIVSEGIGLNEIWKRLNGYSYEKVEEHEGKPIKLETKVTNLSLRENKLEGIFHKDTVIYINQHGYVNPFVRTYESRFRFVNKEKLFLIVLEKKRMANLIANELCKLLFIRLGKIVEAKIDPKIMRMHHEENRENTKVIFFDDVDIPSVEKLSLYGEKLADTMLYQEYLKHGKIWYIVYVSKITGKTVGLTRNGIVVHFDKINQEDFLSFIENEILSLFIRASA